MRPNLARKPARIFSAHRRNSYAVLATPPESEDEELDVEVHVRHKSGFERTLTFPEFVRAIRDGIIGAEDRARSYIGTRNHWRLVGLTRLYGIVTRPTFPKTEPLSPIHKRFNRGLIVEHASESAVPAVDSPAIKPAEHTPDAQPVLELVDYGDSGNSTALVQPDPRPAIVEDTDAVAYHDTPAFVQPGPEPAIFEDTDAASYNDATACVQPGPEPALFEDTDAAAYRDATALVPPAPEPGLFEDTDAAAYRDATALVPPAPEPGMTEIDVPEPVESAVDEIPEAVPTIEDEPWDDTAFEEAIMGEKPASPRANRSIPVSLPAILICGVAVPAVVNLLIWRLGSIPSIGTLEHINLSANLGPLSILTVLLGIVLSGVAARAERMARKGRPERAVVAFAALPLAIAIMVGIYCGDPFDGAWTLLFLCPWVIAFTARAVILSRRA